MSLTRFAVIALACLAVTACPTPLTHFKCYVAEGEVTQQELLRLEDQFHVEEDVKLTKLRYFCNPVTKYVRNEPRQAELDEDHLSCYEIDPQDDFRARVSGRNQFGSTELETRKSELLCVPTLKRGFEELPGSSHCPGGENCCCNMADGRGGMWPDCDPGLECRRQVNTTNPNDAIQVCVPVGTNPGAPLQLHPSQPPFCRLP